MDLHLVEKIKAAVEKSNWTPEEKTLARQVAEDYAGLLIRKMSGEDVDIEIEGVKAQLRNIGAAATATAFNVFSSVLAGVLRELLGLFTHIK